VNIGSYSANLALKYGLTGVMARCTGIKKDIRLSRLETYSNYYYLNFRSFVGQHGDCYDRYLIRMAEMLESLNIISQVINKITLWKKVSTKTSNNYISNLPHHMLYSLCPKKFVSGNYKNAYSSMEELINHFKY
jgi:NADH:ubiquinone oxidoreductase subunit D